VSNSGVTSLVAGTNVTVSGATGAVTVNAPAFATPGSSAVGDSASAGSASTMARSDHVHGREAFGTPVAVTGGATAASGSATTVARSDHVHSTASLPVLIASTTLSSAASSYTFSSIPGTYTHLQIVYMVRGTGTSGAVDLLSYQINSDNTNNYRGSANTSLTNNAWMAYLANANTLYSTQPSVGTTTFYHYADTSSGWAKRAINLFDSETSSGSPSPFTTPWGMAWYTTNTAITSISAKISAGNFAAGSRFSLYGIP